MSYTKKLARTKKDNRLIQAIKKAKGKGKKLPSKKKRNKKGLSWKAVGKLIPQAVGKLKVKK